MNSTPQITLLSWLMIAVLGLTWGGTFLVTKVALSQGMPPFWLAASRISFAALIMGTIWALMGRPLFSEKATPTIKRDVVILGAISSAVPFCLLAWGQQYVSSGFAGVSMAAVALIILPLAHFTVQGEQMTLRKTMGFLIGFAGVVILIGVQAFEATGSAFETFGRMACVLAATCYAVGSILLRRLPAVHPIGLATVLLFVGAAMTIPIAFLIEGTPPIPTPKLLGILAFLGLIPTAGANLLRVLVVRSAGPVFMSLVNYQVPVWSVILGAIILDEALPQSLLLAMSLILTGVALSQYGALRRLFSR